MAMLPVSVCSVVVMRAQVSGQSWGQAPRTVVASVSGGVAKVMASLYLFGAAGCCVSEK
jgi:hypothetical protein